MVLLALWGWEAATWSAIASWVTAGVALAAGLIAYTQLREAGRLRRQQAQPYVVVYLRPSEAGDEFVELVLENLGTTAAHEVGVRIEPTPERMSHGELEEVLFPTKIPTLVPGQRWTTFWDVSVRRDKDLPDLHEATVTFTDLLKNSHRDRFVLDWALERQRGAIRLRGQHHHAEATREIAKQLKDWSRTSSSKGPTIWMRDGDARVRRLRETYESRAPEPFGRRVLSRVRRRARRWLPLTRMSRQ